MVGKVWTYLFILLFLLEAIVWRVEQKLRIFSGHNRDGSVKGCYGMILVGRDQKIFFAFLFYEMMAAWCRNMGFLGTLEFFVELWDLFYEWRKRNPINGFQRKNEKDEFWGCFDVIEIWVKKKVKILLWLVGIKTVLD